MMLRMICYFFFFIPSVVCFGQAISSEELLDRCIAAHDPSGNWNTFEDTLFFTVKSPDDKLSKRIVYIDNANKNFEFWANYEDGKLKYQVSGDSVSYAWNGTKEIASAIKEKYRISSDRAIMYRNYYTYLYGMPMKLKDPGTILHSDVQEVSFHGLEVFKIKVTYTPEVGKDTWYFYIDKRSYLLQAYQFFHDESINDGEYILFRDIITKNGIVIPKNRAWYYNKDDKHLGTDILDK